MGLPGKIEMLFLTNKSRHNNHRKRYNNMTMTSSTVMPVATSSTPATVMLAAKQVFSMPELMKLVYEFDSTYHVPYEKCLAGVTQEAEYHAYLRLGRKLLDTFMMKDMHDLGYKFVRVVSHDTSKLEYDEDEDEDDDDEAMSTIASVETIDSTVSSASLFEASFYTREVTVMCQFKLPDSDEVKMFEAFFEAVEYDSDDKSLTCYFHTLREKPVYSEDMDE
jgi:hypothetical protein